MAAGVGAPLDAFLDLARGSLANVAALGPARRAHRSGPRGATPPPSQRHLDALPPEERAGLRGAGRGGRRRLCRVTHRDHDRRRCARALDAARAAGAAVGFVPTMGYLHAGHASLMAAARSPSTDVVVTSIFVNPLQFAPTEDLAAYPRDLDGDTALAERAGRRPRCSRPSVEEMYPDGPVLTSVIGRRGVGAAGGRARPTHFAGVATVVAKLFAIAGPCRAYFGEKDFQQLAVVRRMVARPVVPGRRRRLPDRARARRPGHVEPQRLPHAGGAGGGARSCTRAAGRARLPIDAGERDPAAVRALMADLIERRAAGRARLRRGRRRRDPAGGRPAGRRAAAARRGPVRPGPPHRQRRAPAPERTASIGSTGRRCVGRRRPGRPSWWPTSTCSCSAPAWPGLSAAVRAAEIHGMRVGVLTKAELAAGDHPLGAGRRGRGARRRPGLHRPAPGRHARRRRRPVRRRRRAGARRRRAARGSTS